MYIPALFDNDLHYKSISKSTVKMISKQSHENAPRTPEAETDLFQEDVRLIAKDACIRGLVFRLVGRHSGKQRN